MANSYEITQTLKACRNDGQPQLVIRKIGLPDCEVRVTADGIAHVNSNIQISSGSDVEFINSEPGYIPTAMGDYNEQTYNFMTGSLIGQSLVLPWSCKKVTIGNIVSWYYPELEFTGPGGAQRFYHIMAPCPGMIGTNLGNRGVAFTSIDGVQEEGGFYPYLLDPQPEIDVSYSASGWPLGKICKVRAFTYEEVT